VRAAFAALVACAALSGCGAAEPETTPTTPPRPPVAAAVTADPTPGPARATMIMVHGGGWAGHDARAQQLLMQTPGKLLLRRGWRVVSIDYEAGARGLDDLLETVDSEIARKTSNGPLCIYGESAGGHLALLAAARRGREIDCVIGLGAPADLVRYEPLAEAGSRLQRIVAGQVRKYFGTSAAELAPSDPVSLAPSIAADVLLMRSGDDAIIPASQSTRFAAAHPATKVVTLQPGDPADPSDGFIHGTISPAGRAAYEQAIASFAAAARRRH
jgi:acetyl esterase/lipase